MKNRIKVLAIILCLLTAFLTPVQSYALGTYYISDIMIVNGTDKADAVNKLKVAGYNNYIDGDVNSGNNGVTLIGYKKTRSKDDAITDLKVMNMKGNYAFENYDDVLKEYKAEADEMRDDIMAAVSEFRENYANGTVAAQFAYKMLNRMTDEDYENDMTGMGDIFLNEDITDEEYTTIFMQSSTIALNTMIQYLAIACDNNWTESIEFDPDKEYTAETADKASVLFDTVVNFRADLTKYEQVCDAYGITEDSSEEDIKAFVDANSKSNPSDVTVFENIGTVTKILKDVQYGDGTLYDLFTKDLDTLDLSEFYPVVDAMTEGQVATLKYIGFTKAVETAVTEDEALTDVLAGMTEDDETSSVSIFEGVDRSIFVADGIAVTTETIREIQASKDGSWYKGNCSKEFELTMYILIGVAAVATVGSAATYGISKAIAAHFVDTDEVVEIGGATFQGTAEYSANAYYVAQYAGYAFWAAVAVLLIVTAIYLITEAVEYIKEKNNRKVETTPIPRMLVTSDIINGKKEYIYYYAAKNTEGQYGDLNNGKGDEWLVLYYTKDTAVDNYVTANFNLQTTSAAEKSTVTTPLTSFISDSAINLNSYTGSGSEIYLFYGSTPASLAGTAVGASGMYAVFGVCGVAVGAAITLVVGKLTGKKKKEETLA